VRKAICWCSTAVRSACMRKQLRARPDVERDQSWWRCDSPWELGVDVAIDRQAASGFQRASTYIGRRSSRIRRTQWRAEYLDAPGWRDGVGEPAHPRGTAGTAARYRCPAFRQARVGLRSPLELSSAELYSFPTPVAGGLARTRLIPQHSCAVRKMRTS